MTLRKSAPGSDCGWPESDYVNFRGLPNGSYGAPNAVLVGDREEVVQVVGEVRADRVRIGPGDVAPARAVLLEARDVGHDVDSARRTELGAGSAGTLISVSRRGWGDSEPAARRAPARAPHRLREPGRLAAS